MQPPEPHQLRTLSLHFPRSLFTADRDMFTKYQEINFGHSRFMLYLVAEMVTLQCCGVYSFSISELYLVTVLRLFYLKGLIIQKQM